MINRIVAGLLGFSAAFVVVCGAALACALLLWWAERAARASRIREQRELQRSAERAGGKG